jgi:hypothetical protein
MTAWLRLAGQRRALCVVTGLSEELTQQYAVVLGVQGAWRGQGASLCTHQLLTAAAVGVGCCAKHLGAITSSMKQPRLSAADLPQP